VRLEGDAWESLFDSFEREAFRLETLPVYRVREEAERIEHFLATGDTGAADDDGWRTEVQHHRDTGRWIGRVHVVSRPLTDYLRFEFTSQKFSVQAGEEVRVLDLADTPNPGLPDQDFWMFDESTVVRMDYAEDGTQIGRELLEAADPAPYVEYKRLAMAHSEPLLDYCARIGL